MLFILVSTNLININEPQKAIIHQQPVVVEIKNKIVSQHTPPSTLRIKEIEKPILVVQKAESPISVPKLDFKNMHFVHIPKCGGTSMTAVLRDIACQLDRTINSDCCLNPGFCDWHEFRRCAMMKGCINHFPQK